MHYHDKHNHSALAIFFCACAVSNTAKTSTNVSVPCYFHMGQNGAEWRRSQKDLGSIFFISLQKISQSTKYFVCYLYSYYLRISRNHSSVIKKFTILQWFYIPLGSKMTLVVLMRLRVEELK